MIFSYSLYHMLWLLIGRHSIACFSPLKRQSRLQQTTFINIFSLFFRENKTDVSSESSARQRIHTKNQALFPSKDKSALEGLSETLRQIS